MAIFTDEQKDYLDATYKRKDDCEADMKNVESTANDLTFHRYTRNSAYLSSTLA